MTTDSPPPPRLPTARPRARPPAGASAAATAAAAAPGDQPDEIAPTPSLIGEGPGQYLLHCENRRSFDEMKAAFDGELRPADPIERLWVDEIVDLEWDLHRLRTARRAVVETTLTENLARKVSELNKALANSARARFMKEPKVQILQGDSAIILRKVLNDLNRPAVFWLDGHYSGGITSKGEKDTPILEELKCVLSHPIKNHIILIDDARCFIGEFDYPTLFEIYELVKGVDRNYKVNVKDDIIRIGYAI